MVEAHVLIGNPHTRKATLMRCLTGCFNRSVRDIALQGGGQIRLYVRVAALQDSRTEPAAFIDEVARSRCQHIAFSLWPEGHPHDSERLPGAQAYLNAFREAGWTIGKVALLGAHPLRLDLKRGVAPFPNVLHQPVNASAQLVRQHFGWL